jgi:hypothetical protein
MVGILPMAVVALLSTAPAGTAAMFDFNFNFNSMPLEHVDWDEVDRVAKAKTEHQEALQNANQFYQWDLNKILESKEKELRSVNALLTRNKEDFRKVREQDDQDGRFTKTKVEKIFKVPLYRYEPNRNLFHLSKFLFDTLENSTTDKNEKIEKVKSMIDDIKGSLIYIRDLCERKYKKRLENGWDRKPTFFEVFVYLYHVDIRLAVARHNKEWDKYKEILEEVKNI